MGNPVSNEFLERRVKALHSRLAANQLTLRGLEATPERLKLSLSRSTVSVVETTVNGKAVRIVTTNDTGFYKLLQQSPQNLLLPGEVLGSRPTYVYGPKEPKQRPPRQTIHAEQLGVNDARKMGATSGRIATSNPGCTHQCIALLNEEFPTFQHVNPASTAPDPHIPSGAAHAGGGGSVAGTGSVSSSGNAATKTAGKIDDAARGLDDAARGLSNNPRGLGNSLGTAGAPLRGARVAATAVRIATRVVGRIALGIILPPFTPGAIIFEVAIFLLFSWFEKLEKEAEERAIRKALEAIQPQIHDALKLPSKREEAAALLVKDWEAGGVGFVYLSLDISLYKDEMHKAVRKSEHDGLARTTVTSVQKFTEWSAKFNGLSFSNRYVEAPNAKPDTRSMGQDWERTIYPLRFMEQVPFLTVFDLLSAKFSSLLVMLDEARWSLVDASWDNPEYVERSIASERGFGSSPQDNVTLSGITYPYEVDAASYALSIREIQRIISQLQSHRSPLGAKMRVLMAPDTRRMILYGVNKGMQELVKEVGSIYKSQAGAPVAKEAANPFLEAVDLAHQIVKDCERATTVDKKFFVYDFDEEVRKYLMAQ